MKYIPVYSWGGIICELYTGHDLKTMKEKMKAYLDHAGFDPHIDDARIFDQYGR